MAASSATIHPRACSAATTARSRRAPVKLHSAGSAKSLREERPSAPAAAPLWPQLSAPPSPTHGKNSARGGHRPTRGLSGGLSASAFPPAALGSSGGEADGPWQTGPLASRCAASSAPRTSADTRQPPAAAETRVTATSAPAASARPRIPTTLVWFSSVYLRCPPPPTTFSAAALAQRRFRACSRERGAPRGAPELRRGVPGKRLGDEPQARRGPRGENADVLGGRRAQGAQGRAAGGVDRRRGREGGPVRAVCGSRWKGGTEESRAAVVTVCRGGTHTTAHKGVRKRDVCQKTHEGSQTDSTSSPRLPPEPISRCTVRRPA